MLHIYRQCGKLCHLAEPRPVEVETRPAELWIPYVILRISKFNKLD